MKIGTEPTDVTTLKVDCTKTVCTTVRLNLGRESDWTQDSVVFVKYHRHLDPSVKSESE
jgi:hypothetical protein